MTFNQFNDKLFLDYIKRLGLTSEPKLHNTENISDYFDDYGIINWKLIH